MPNRKQRFLRKKRFLTSFPVPGADGLAAIAAQLEQMAEDNSFSAAAGVAAEFRQKLTTIHDKLRAYLEQHATSTTGE